MFNVGGGEILVIAVIALVVLGPQRLPSAARQIGRAMGELRRMSSSFQSELRTALDDEPPSRAAGREVRPLGTPSARAEEASVDRALRAVSDQAAPVAPPSPASAPSRPRRTPLRAAPADAPAGDDGPSAPRRASS